MAAKNLTIAKNWRGFAFDRQILVEFATCVCKPLVIIAILYSSGKVLARRWRKLYGVYCFPASCIAFQQIAFTRSFHLISHMKSKFSIRSLRSRVLQTAATGFASVATLYLTGNLVAQSFLIGGYGDGIYSSSLDSTGKMSEPKLAVKQRNPSFFAFHPKLDVLYSISESPRTDAGSPAAIAAYSFDRAQAASGGSLSLKLLNLQKIDGDGPCHVVVDAKGEFLAVANYGSGSALLLPIDERGALKPASSVVQHSGKSADPKRQDKAHAHCSFWDPTNRYLFVSDLGLDKIFVYDFDRSLGGLKPAKHPSFSLAPGSGPRHLAIHQNGRWVYIINELNMTLTAAAWDATEGKLTEIHTVSTLPVDAEGDNFSTAEVLVHPSGRFVYGSNRGHHTIASFRVDPSTGKLTPIGHTPTGGKTPRNFRITPKGDFLLAENQQSDSVHSFRIDESTGELKPTGFSIAAPAPACIKFLE